MKEEQRIHLQHYLLGELNEQEREALAERYFIDEELFNELLEVENKLFDQYVRDELSPTEKKQFVSYIQGLPDGNFKLATAQALSHASAEKTSTSIREERTIESASLWQSIRNLFVGRQFVFQYALASLLLIALVSVVYFYFHQRQLQKENEQLRARVSQSEKDKENLNRQAKDTEHEKSEQQERIEQLEEELARVEAQKEKNTGGTQDKEPSIISTIATLILTPTLRSANKPDLLRLKPETKIVSITVKFVSREQIESFRAVLQINDGGGQIVLTRENLKPVGTLQNRRITFTIPAKKLTERSYKVTLQGRTTDGIEIVQEHYFEIVEP